MPTRRSHRSASRGRKQRSDSRTDSRGAKRRATRDRRTLVPRTPTPIRRPAEIGRAHV
jgi:hypothetical protein